MKRSLFVLATVTALAMSGIVIAASVARTAMAMGGGGTSASVSGTSVTITVNFDLCCAATAAEQTIYGPLVAAEVQAAQAEWNQALARLPARGCFTINVVFSEHLLTKAAWDAGYHQIHIDFTHPGRPMSYDYTPGGTHNDDTTWVYTHTTDGNFYENSMSVAIWAHEIGHLMGLGDDYYEHAFGHRGSSPLPGRDGTMMYNNGTIDQVLADRLADIAAKSGLMLPSCWKGTQTEMLVVGPCTSTVQATMAFVVAGNGAVKGTWEGAETVVGCNSHAPFGLGRYPISGKLAGQKFLFPMFPGLIGYPGPVSIPLVSPSSASGHFAWSLPAAGPGTGDINLTCTGC